MDCTCANHIFLSPSLTSPQSLRESEFTCLYSKSCCERTLTAPDGRHRDARLSFIVLVRHHHIPSSRPRHGFFSSLYSRRPSLSQACLTTIGPKATTTPRRCLSLCFGQIYITLNWHGLLASHVIHTKCDNLADDARGVLG